MIGILLYLLTTAFIPLWFYVVLFLWIYIFERERYQYCMIKNKIFFNQIVLLMLLSCINFIIHVLFCGYIEIPQFIFIPIIVYIAFSIKENDINYIVPLICLEGVVGLLEFSAEVTSFFPQYLGSEDSFRSDEELLYFKRVAGLSAGVSSYGLKLLVGIVLCEFTSYSKRWKKEVLQVFLIICLIMSFHRTSLVAGFIFIIWKCYFECKRNKNMPIFYGGCLLALVFAAYYIDINYLVEQFTRSTGQLELAGRDYIWNNAWDHILNHPMEGNGSFRFRMSYHGVTAHCHNSFIQMIANNGMIIGSFYLWIMLHKLNKSNFIYAFPLLLSSMSQYFLFNGCSFQDIIYVMILFKDDIFLKQKVGFTTNRSIVNFVQYGSIK